MEEVLQLHTSLLIFTRCMTSSQYGGGYEIRYRPLTGSSRDYITRHVTDNMALLEDLEPNVRYGYQVRRTMIDRSWSQEAEFHTGTWLAAGIYYLTWNFIIFIYCLDRRVTVCACVHSETKSYSCSWRVDISRTLKAKPQMWCQSNSENHFLKIGENL